MYVTSGYGLMRLHISSMNDRGSRGGARQGPPLFFALFLSLPPETTRSQFLKGGHWPWCQYGQRRSLRIRHPVARTAAPARCRETALQMYILTAVIDFVQGGVQALNRSMYSP